MAWVSGGREGSEVRQYYRVIKTVSLWIATLGGWGRSEEHRCKTKRREAIFLALVCWGSTDSSFYILTFVKCLVKGVLHAQASVTLTSPFEQNTLFNTTTGFHPHFPATWQVVHRAQWWVKWVLEGALNKGTLFQCMCTVHILLVILHSLSLFYLNSDPPQEVCLALVLHWIRLIWFEPVMNLIGFLTLISLAMA